MKEIQVPSGLRDILREEAYTRNELIKGIEQVFESWGYEPIVTPTIEFYRTYEKAYENLRDEEMYKFFDPAGRILTLREDMTVPIARVAASKFSLRKPPLRFRYRADVYKVSQSFAGKRNEVTDCGVELIGEDENGDIEILVMALEVLKKTGVTGYTLEIGNSRFFKQACVSAGLEERDRAELAELVDTKSLPDLAEYLQKLALPEAVQAFFRKLPLLSGNRTMLEEAVGDAFDAEMKSEIGHLLKIDDQLRQLGYGDCVTYDLSKAAKLDYYTGIIFEGFVEGVGTCVLSGGRYDALLKKFGRDLPACGFGVRPEYLAEVVSMPKEEPVEMHYTTENYIEKMKEAASLRDKGKNVVMVREEL